MTPFSFVPPPNGPFIFAPTLDGKTFNGVVTWNLFCKGEGYYLNLYAQDGSLVVCEKLIGSEDGVRIQSLAWANGIVTATTSAPHGFDFLATVMIAITGCVPDAYNGVVTALVTGDSTFIYPLAVNPGDLGAFGTVSADIDLVAGYFDTSRLVFRQTAQQFEVTP